MVIFHIEELHIVKWNRTFCSDMELKVC